MNQKPQHDWLDPVDFHHMVEILSPPPHPQRLYTYKLRGLRVEIYVYICRKNQCFDKNEVSWECYIAGHKSMLTLHHNPFCCFITATNKKRFDGINQQHASSYDHPNRTMEKSFLVDDVDRHPHYYYDDDSV